MYDALGRVTNFFKWISVSSFFYVTKFLHSSYTFRKKDFPQSFVDNFFRRIRIYKFRKLISIIIFDTDLFQIILYYTNTKYQYYISKNFQFDTK